MQRVIAQGKLEGLEPDFFEHFVVELDESVNLLNGDVGRLLQDLVLPVNADKELLGLTLGIDVFVCHYINMHLSARPYTRYQANEL